MPLADYLTIDSIVPDMVAMTKNEALGVLVEAMYKRCPGMAKNNVLEILQARESLGSTGIGDGVAIPHGKLDSCPGVMLAVGRSIDGCDFASVDDKKCHVFSLLLAPESLSAGQFGVLAHLARIFKSNAFRDNFMQAKSAEEIWDLLNAAWEN
ncbi:MAG: PTS sugar transporter subunit IIA [Deltaproteobacteria bacterium]|jgi:PTS system nitrogen regulatory IIA component|nr:PTS sugar transporter subunit IIA [Deltaproteobacteria bacterium]